MKNKKTTKGKYLTYFHKWSCTIVEWSKWIAEIIKFPPQDQRYMSPKPYLPYLYNLGHG
jgi:hypothetical protein